jgi:hypothetical protein
MPSWLVVINDYDNPLVSSVVEADTAADAVSLAIAAYSGPPWREILVQPANVTGQPLTGRAAPDHERESGPVVGRVATVTVERPRPTRAQRVALVTAFRDVFLADIHTVVDLIAASPTRADAVRTIGERYGLDEHTAAYVVDGQLFHLTGEGRSGVDRVISDMTHDGTV